MTDRIGQLWQEGESLAASSSIHQGLICFLKAKTLLNNEEVVLLGHSKSQRTGEILANLLDKLNQSIEKYAIKLERNPILALELSQRFTKGDVKKAYRRSALKYHPDKNGDCDTSRIFTTVQSAYEKLSLIAPDGPPSESQTQKEKQPAPKPTPTSDLPAKTKPENPFPRKSSFSNSDYGNRETSKSSNKSSTNKPQQTQSQSQVPPQPQPQQQQSSQPQYTKPTASSASSSHSPYPDPSTLSTEQLREVIRQFGFLRADGMGRGELLKKYLAVRAHLDFVAPKQPASRPQGFDGLDAGLARAWTEAMRREMDRDKDRERDKARSAQTGKDEKPSTGAESKSSFTTTPGPSPATNSSQNQYSHANAYFSGNSGGGTASQTASKTEDAFVTRGRSDSRSGSSGVDGYGKSVDGRAEKADRERRARVQRLKEDLPGMGITELKRLIFVSGISDEGCFEKVDLLQLLYNHFGIIPDPILASPGASHQPSASSMRDKEDKTSTDASRRSSKGFKETAQKRPESVGTAESTSTPAPKVSNKMDISSLRNVLKKTGVSVSVGEGKAEAEEDHPQPSPSPRAEVRDRGVMTKEKLKALEQKVFGMKMKRPSSSDGKQQPQPAAFTSSTENARRHRSSFADPEMTSSPALSPDNHQPSPVASGLPPRPSAGSPVRGGVTGSDSAVAQKRTHIDAHNAMSPKLSSSFEWKSADKYDEEAPGFMVSQSLAELPSSKPLNSQVEDLTPNYPQEIKPHAKRKIFGKNTSSTFEFTKSISITASFELIGEVKSKAILDTVPGKALGSTPPRPVSEGIQNSVLSKISSNTVDLAPEKSNSGGLAVLSESSITDTLNGIRNQVLQDAVGEQTLDDIDEDSRGVVDVSTNEAAAAAQFQNATTYKSGGKASVSMSAKTSKTQRRKNSVVASNYDDSDSESVDPAEWRFVLLENPDEKKEEEQFMKYFEQVNSPSKPTAPDAEMTANVTDSAAGYSKNGTESTSEQRIPVLDDPIQSLDPEIWEDGLNSHVHLPTGGIGFGDYNESFDLDDSSDDDPMDWIPNVLGKESEVSEEGVTVEDESELEIEKYNRKLLKAFLSSFNLKANIDPHSQSKAGVDVTVGVLLLSDSDDEEDVSNLKEDDIHIANGGSSRNSDKLVADANISAVNLKSYDAKAIDCGEENIPHVGGDVDRSKRLSSAQRLRLDATKHRKAADAIDSSFHDLNSLVASGCSFEEFASVQQSSAVEAKILQEEVEFWSNNFATR